MPIATAVYKGFARCCAEGDEEADDFAFRLASECIQSLLFLYLCQADMEGDFLWVYFGCIQTTQVFLLCSAQRNARRSRGFAELNQKKQSPSIQSIAIDILINLVVLFSFGSLLISAVFLCEGEEEAFYHDRHQVGEFLVTALLWSMGEYVSCGWQKMLNNFRDWRGDLGRINVLAFVRHRGRILDLDGRSKRSAQSADADNDIIDHFVLAFAALFPFGFVLYHGEFAWARLLTPFPHLTGCSLIGCAYDVFLVFPSICLMAAAFAVPISILIVIYQQQDIDDAVTKPEQSPFWSSGLRTFTVLLACMLMPNAVFLLVKWAPLNERLFDTRWCVDRPVFSVEVAAVRYNLYGIDISLFPDNYTHPLGAILPLIGYTALADLPFRALFASCYPSYQEWHDTMLTMFSHESAIAADLVLFRRESSSRSEMNGEVTPLYAYQCGQPSASSVSGYCGTRCLPHHAFLNFSACTFKHGQRAISCECCESEHHAKLSSGPRRLCAECCAPKGRLALTWPFGGRDVADADFVPRAGRHIGTVAKENAVREIQIEDEWVHDKMPWEDAHPPYDLFWWLDPFLLWALYAAVALGIFPEVTPAANTASMVILVAYFCGVYSRYITLLVQLLMAMVADHRIVEILFAEPAIEYDSDDD